MLFQLICIKLSGGKWTKLFYRLLDSLEGEDGDRMRVVEAEMFQDKFKDHDHWKGTIGENRATDGKIAAAVRASLSNYEKKRKADEEYRFK